MAQTQVQKYLNSQPNALEGELAERRWLRNMEDSGVSALGPLSPGLEELYVEIPVRSDSWRSTCKIIRPSTPSQKKKRTLVVMFHGGAFQRGSPEMYTRPGREFASEFDVVVVSVEYRLAPEHPWPTACLDAYDVVSYLTDAAGSGSGSEIFGQGVAIDTDGFVLAGASSGGNIACSVLNMSLLTAATEQSAQTYQRPPLKMPVRGIYLGIPFLLVDEIVPEDLKDMHTSHSNDTAEVLNFCGAVLKAYNPDVRSPLFSPVNLQPSFLAMWPKTYVQVGEKDVWRDDGVILDAMLRRHGVDVKIDRYKDLGHTTWSVYTTGPEDGIESELGGKSRSAMKWLLGRADE